jgi:hypothetical protein
VDWGAFRRVDEHSTDLGAIFVGDHHRLPERASEVGARQRQSNVCIWLYSDTIRAASRRSMNWRT